MKQSTLINLRFFVASVLSLLLPIGSFAQNYLSNWLESYRISGDFPTVQALTPEKSRPAPDNLYGKGAIYSLSDATLQPIITTAPLTLEFAIPGNQDIALELAQVSLVAPDFSVGALGLQPQENLPYQQGLHYRGIVKGNPNSIASLSIFSDGIVGMYADETGTYQLAKLENGSGKYILYRTTDLPVDAPHQCFTDENIHSFESTEGGDDRGVGCKVVNIYFECDYKLYQDKGSNTTNVTNYVTALFNQVATLYAIENIGVAISQVYVWTTPDPYVSLTSTSAVLSAFRNNRGTTFNGNLAHFLSTRSLGGGIAFVDVICLKQYAFGVSAITTTFQNVPTYSWSVEVVTHELGHNLGSWHTHSCNWPTGALDNCITPEGSCAPGPTPVNGGTIMSYCHLTSNGINFNNGFGPTPGSHVRTKVQSASCLTTTTTVPGGLAATNITGNSATLSWVSIPGATTYIIQYKPTAAGAWQAGGTTMTPSFILTGLQANTSYDWQVKTDCSAYSGTSTFSTNTGSGGGGTNCSAPEGLATGNITSSAATLTWSAVTGATNYTVEYQPANAGSWTTAGTITGTTFALSNLSAATAYNWHVKASCSSFSGNISFTTQTNGSGSCSAPSGLTSGNVTSGSVTLSWSAVSGASNYTVEYKLNSASSWTNAGTTAGTSLSMSGLVAGSTYNWHVKANCSVYSATSNFTTASGGGGGTCSAPTGLMNNSVTATLAVISWTPVSGAVNYTLQLKYANSTSWFTLGTVSGTNITITGLQPATSYHWRVKASCSVYSNSLLLVTPAGLGEPPVGGLPTLVAPQLDLYPNPASVEVHLNYQGTVTPDTRIRLCDVTGRIWIDDQLISAEQTIPVSACPNGVYFLQVLENGAPMVVKRVVKVE